MKSANNNIWTVVIFIFVQILLKCLLCPCGSEYSFRWNKIWQYITFYSAFSCFPAVRCCWKEDFVINSIFVRKVLHNLLNFVINCSHWLLQNICLHFRLEWITNETFGSSVWPPIFSLLSFIFLKSVLASL